MLPEALSDPRLLTALTLVLAVIIKWQRTLSWTEYRTYHSLKRGILPLIDKHTTLFVVSRKGFRDDAEFVATVDKSVRETFKGLTNDGFSPHLINSIKQRPHPDYEGPQYSAAHLVKFHEDEQVEVYLFKSGNGGCDVYAHTETSVTDPEGHFSDEQIDGDKYGYLPKWIAKD